LETFEKFYKGKQYRQALDYLQKHQQDLDPGIFHYNFGLLMIHNENWPLARYHFLMAENNGVLDKALFVNEKLVEEKLDTARYEEPQTINDYFIKYSMEMSAGYYTTLSLIFLIGGLVIVRKISNLRAWTIWSLLVLAPILYNYWVDSWEKVIVEKEIVLMDGPSNLFLTEKKIPPGALLVLKTKDGWSKVIYPSELHGWIRDTDYKRIYKL